MRKSWLIRVLVPVTAVGALAVAVPGAAHAQDSNPFGNVSVQDKGQLATVYAALILADDSTPEPSLSSCNLNVILTDPNGALGRALKQIPCTSGTYALSVPSLDGIAWGVGDTDQVTLEVTGVDANTGASVTVAEETVSVVAQ
ncbi:hypothetical protein ACPCKL_16985 [Streptomyces cellulosae]